jgi:hypothetical protein
MTDTYLHILIFHIVFAVIGYGIYRMNDLMTNPKYINDNTVTHFVELLKSGKSIKLPMLYIEPVCNIVTRDGYQLIVIGSSSKVKACKRK